ncbi:MAG: hypothetical protein Q9182_006276 [Xanthomendoza sp. 2 TL-2023]
MVGFGFSVGDFIGAIKLVGTVIDALSASSKSSAELQELLRQFQSLENALREIENLRVDDTLHAEVLALKQSAAQCQDPITAFLRKMEPYQSHLLVNGGASNSLQSKWRKIKWALCEKNDVVRLKIDLLAHTESIQLLLSTIQMKHLDLGQKSQKTMQSSIASIMQASFSSCMRKMSVMGTAISTISAHAQECLENSRRIISMNLRVFQVVLEVQNLLKSMPGQVERQQPVYLNDALGRYAPFHLEFIRSKEALISVLSINFKWVGSASRMIMNGDFAIHDSRTQRDIDLNRPWEECFIPGQQVDMSMIFERRDPGSTLCPRCDHECVANPVEYNSCEHCNLVFKRIEEEMDFWQFLRIPLAGTGPSKPVTSTQRTEVSRQDKLRRQPEDEDSEDLERYHRVRFRVLQYPWMTHVSGFAEGNSRRSNITGVSEMASGSSLVMGTPNQAFRT